MRFIDADALTYHKHVEVINGRKVYFDIVHKSEIDDAPTGIVFLCDGKACDGDCKDCKHTKDIAHARNFYKTVAGWAELNEQRDKRKARIQLRQIFRRACDRDI